MLRSRQLIVRLRFIVFSTLAASFIGHAQAQVSQKVVKNFKTKHETLFRTIQNLEVSFEQKSYRKLRNRVILRKGHAFFSQPSRFQWIYKDAQFGSEEYYFDGNNFTHFLQRDKVANVYGAKIGLGRELKQVVDLVLNPDNLLKDFHLEKMQEEKTDLSFTLRPKKEQLQNSIKDIFVKISGKKAFISKIIIKYVDENYTDFSFSKPKFAAIAAEKFQFQRKDVKINVIK